MANHEWREENFPREWELTLDCDFKTSTTQHP